MTVLLADDDPLVTTALQTILQADSGITVAGTAQNGRQAVELYCLHKPDLGLFDIRMGDMTGLDAAETILQKFPDARILFLTTFSDNEYIMQALRLGAMGYILKQDFDKIIPALYAAHAGQSVLGGEIVAKLPAILEQKKTADFTSLGIEAREQEIIELVAQGFSNKEIAQRIFLSEGTVRNYISVVLEKLNLRDRTQLAIFYYKSQQT